MKALKKITYKLKKKKSIIHDYAYVEDDNKLKLIVREYISKEKKWYEGPYQEEIYSLQARKNPIALKELAALFHVFFKAMGKKQGYIEGWLGQEKMGTKHYLKNLEIYERQVLDKYEKEMKEKEKFKKLF